MGKKKPQNNRIDETGLSDRCYTPAYALDPILPYLKPGWVIWEPAAGGGNMVRVFESSGFSVVAGDIDTGQDFFKYEPARWDVQITNPPYNVRDKYRWIERSYQLGKPFALLMQLDTLGVESAACHFRQYGVQVISITPRVNFIMPNAGLTGGGAHFPVSWFTWGLNLPRDLMFVQLTPRPDEQLTMFDVSMLATVDAGQLAMFEEMK